MNRWFLGSVAAVMVFAPVSMVRADDAKAQADLNSYLQQLSVTLQHTAQRVNQPSSEGASVVGLRGSKQETSSQKLYWKGVQGPTPITVDEIKKFRGAIEQARAGQTAEAVMELNAFEKQYPKSAMLPDVEKARQRLSAATPTSKS